MLDLVVQHVWPQLLLAYWVLASGAVIATLVPGAPLPRAFKDAVRLSAARGKLWADRPQSLGALNDASVPQAWFLHFYAIGTACCAVLLSMSALASEGTGPHAAGRGEAHVEVLAVALFTCHLVRRLLETRWLMVYPPGARMHVIAYAFGCTYYAVAPCSLMAAGFWRPPGGRGAPGGAPTSALFWLQAPAAGERLGTWAAQRLRLLGQGLARAAPRQAAAAVLGLVQAQAWRQLAGAAVLVAGMAIQWHSHWLLAGLAHRQAARVGKEAAAEKEGRPGRDAQEAAYVIPRGGLFELVSCPHYLGEVVIYAGLALLCWPSTKPLLMLLWVVVNLVLAAGATQSWYLRRFKGTYPPGRRALIPFLW